MCKEKMNFRVIAAGFYLCNDNNLEEALELLDDAASKGENIPDEVIVLDTYEYDPIENIISYINDLEALLKSVYNKGFEAGKNGL